MLINQSTLLSFLAAVRPARSHAEEIHVAIIIKLATDLGYAPYQDAHGNIIVDNLADTTSRVMFTSHTDSIHRKASHDTQQLNITGNGIVTVNLKETPESSCLGADDATGNYIMLRLLQAGVKGLYVFFRDEEIGGLGSSYFAGQPNNAELIASLTHCISFDRMGYDSIITHQSCGRCASDEFAADLGALIKKQDTSELLDYYADDTGTFTDSANFSSLISECSNLSVGYFKQHTVKESQDIVFADALCEALTKVDWCNLAHYRDPTVIDRTDYYLYDQYPYSSYDDLMVDDTAVYEDEIDNIYKHGYNHAFDMAINNPELAAELLVYLTR